VTDCHAKDNLRQADALVLIKQKTGVVIVDGSVVQARFDRAQSDCTPVKQ
jgi:hypothetical protein